MNSGLDRRDYYHSSSSLSPVNSPSAPGSDNSAPFPVTSHLYSALQNRSPSYRHLNYQNSTDSVMNNSYQTEHQAQVKVEIEDGNSDQEQYQFMSSYGTTSYSTTAPSMSFAYTSESFPQQDGYQKSACNDTSGAFPFSKDNSVSNFNTIHPTDSSFVPEMFGDIDGKELDRYLTGSASFQAQNAGLSDPNNLIPASSAPFRPCPPPQDSLFSGQYPDFSKTSFGSHITEGAMQNKVGMGGEQGDTMSVTCAALRSLIS